MILSYDSMMRILKFLLTYDHTAYIRTTYPEVLFLNRSYVSLFDSERAIEPVADR